MARVAPQSCTSAVPVAVDHTGEEVTDELTLQAITAWTTTSKDQTSYTTSGGLDPARSDSLFGAVSRSRQALATQIPDRLAERLRVGNLPSG
jgi:hypothetical protein